MKFFFVDFEPEPLNYIHSFDFFMMPSRNEGFGLTVLESLSVSTPVICSKLEVFQELYQGMVSFIDEDKFDLNSVLNVAMINQDVQLEYSHQKIEEKYSVDVMCNKLQYIYKSISSVR
nr:glycosyltransferase [Photobacterium iliopiscarium]